MDLESEAPVASSSSTLFILDDDPGGLLAGDPVAPSGTQDILQQALASVTTDEQSGAGGEFSFLDDLVPTSLDSLILPSLQPEEPPAKDEEVVTVFKALDGTLQLSAEQARILGIDKKTPSPTPTKHQPSLIRRTPTPQPTPPKLSPSPSLVLIPTTRPDGTVAYVVKTKSPQQAQQPQLRPNILANPTVISRPPPTVMARKISPATQPLMASLRPVMSPTVVTTVRPRAKPILLPKPPPAALKTVKAIQPSPLPVILPRAASNQNVPLGSSGNPIQLFQKGSTFHTMQPLNAGQVTQVANVLKKTKTDKPVENSQQIITDKSSSTRVVYKVLYPEDLGLPSGDYKKNDEESEDDEEPSNVENYYPHELFPKAFAKRGRIIRKRGRPRRGDVLLEKPELHAKKLRKEFGLTLDQLQSVENDIVSDKSATMDEGRDGEESSEETTGEVRGVSRTRSGRMSKPPPPKDKNLGYAASQEEKEKREEEARKRREAEEARPKRKFSVPARYKCKVCHKIYLGDRKMNKHVKLFPSHGPSEEPPSKPVASSLASVLPVTTAAMMPGGKKMPEFSIPIIPMARTQLEDLVKNLDAELVLDVVAKKMFDNFSMWELETKKSSVKPEKGVKKLERLLDDLEKMIGEVKNVVDNCLTDTKLSSEDSKTETILFGENVQSALNLHEGPWYLEQAKHISEEYQKLLNIQPPVMVSPRSDSASRMTMHEEENSNSMMSMASEDKDGQHSSSNHGLGAQMVLERNLGAESLDIDEDTQDCSNHNVKKDEFDDSKLDTRSMETGSLADSQEEDSNISATSNLVSSTLIAAAQSHDVDPKKVLEQNGINISACSEEPESVDNMKTLNVSSSDLAREIESLGPFTASASDLSTSENANSESNYQRTPLPSFSTIIGGSSPTKASELPTTEELAITTAETALTTTSVMTDSSSTLVTNLAESHQDEIAAISSVLSSSSHHQHTIDSCAGSPAVMASSAGHVDLPSSLPIIDHLHSALQQHLPSNSLGTLRPSGPPSVDNLASSLHQQSGPPSVDYHHQQAHISGPPSVDLHHQAAHLSGPPSVDPHPMHMSGPPSVDHHGVQQQGMDRIGATVPNSPCCSVDYHHQVHSVPAQSGPASIHGGSNPPSVDMRMVHHSNPASIDHHHQSIPNSPLNEVLSDVEGGKIMVEKRRNSISNVIAPGEDRPSPVAGAGVMYGPCVSSGAVMATDMEPILIDSGILNPGVAGGVIVTAATSFSGNTGQETKASGQEEPKTSEQSASKDLLPPPPPVASVGGIDPNAVGGDSSASNFLSDLDSVLNDDTDFPFHSALNSDSMQLKTPEKLLQSIPPSSMMTMKPKAKGAEGGSENAMDKASTSVSRTNFLGALSSPSAQSKIDPPPMGEVPSSSFTEAQSSLSTVPSVFPMLSAEPAASTAAEASSHEPIVQPSESSNAGDEDSLSKLFNEIPQEQTGMKEASESRENFAGDTADDDVVIVE